MTRPALLEARGLLVRKGGETILEVPSLELQAGETLALVGPNGAGKSTLLLALAAIDPPAAGELCFRGEAIPAGSGSVGYRRRLAMVFQEPLLFDASVFDNVASGLRIRGVGGAERRRRTADSLERFRVAHLRTRSARTLSGGEAQRVSLARALATEPELLLLDEPFAALDPPTREALMDDLEATLRDTGTTAVFATHDRLEALRLADRLAVMHQGRILQLGPPAEVMNRPADGFVASFVGVEAILEGVIASAEEGCLKAVVGEREFEVVGDALPGERVLLCVRPENVTLSLGQPHETTSARNNFTGVVERVVSLGHYRRVILNCGFPLTALVTNRSAEELALRPGTLVTAAVKATAIHLIRKSGSDTRDSQPRGFPRR